MSCLQIIGFLDNLSTVMQHTLHNENDQLLKINGSCTLDVKIADGHYLEWLPRRFLLRRFEPNPP